MARIRTTRGFSATRVSIAGRFTASDMGRFEHACAEALTAERLRLELDMSRVTGMDETAAAVVGRLERRGAIIRDRPRATTPDDAFSTMEIAGRRSMQQKGE